MEERFTKTKAILAALGIALAAASGCADTEGDKAVNKLEECGLPSAGTGLSGECSGVSRCEADGIDSHSCAEIQQAYGGTPNAYSACDDACS